MVHPVDDLDDRLRQPPAVRHADRLLPWPTRDLTDLAEAPSGDEPSEAWRAGNARRAW